METVYVKIFEDYKIVDNYIHPMGDMSVKKLTNNDILEAITQFISIKTPKDVIRFAKRYGLLNGYDFEIYWWDLPKKFFKKDIEIDTKNKEKVVQKMDIDIKFFKKWIKDILSLANSINESDKIVNFFPPLQVYMFFSGSIFRVFRDSRFTVYINCGSNDDKKSVRCNFPTDKNISYRGDNGIFLYRYGWSVFDCGKIVDLKVAEEDRKQYDGKRMEIYVDTLLYILENIYDNKTKTITANYFFHCIGEHINDWLLRAKSLKDYLRIMNNSRKNQISKEDVNNAIEEKIYSSKYIKDAQLKIFYDDDGKPKIDITFDNLYDALEWFAISNKGRLKICPTCRNAFIGRKNQIYCSNNCKFNNWYSINSKHSRNKN